jgi:hypothetical protein
VTPGCYICDPAEFHSDEEPCMECFMRWDAYYFPAAPPIPTEGE